VSAGLGPRISRSLYAVFIGRRTDGPPWRAQSGSADGVVSSAVWLRPGCVAAVEYREYTAAGRFRHLAFKGLVPADEGGRDWLLLPRRGS